MKHDRAQFDERLTKKSFQFGISQILLLTAITALVVACVKYLPGAVYVPIILAFFGVPIIPFAILFAAIALGPEKNGHLTVHRGSLKCLVVAWIICVITSASTCLLIYLGIVY